ncbi:MAG: hydroxyacid dehydrogenase [Acidimicrobiia bacterium]|nr:hydroxyacid dehydrogenase [Acidimicrobiia bacterium]NNL13495.1 hydroxyacid dehydrogenase [Acidimicrobiia bacterium]NNL97303.1 hydroxyacid dehydrogenase [Acidimicrobiia bacterium]RZV47346.1 MAG: hydroxyacid dehydrogenase [Acidimicrobiia bacterium]
MAEIVISEFMDEDAVAGLQADFDVHYDPNLVDAPEDLAGLLADARALVVRNRTQVRPDLLAAAPRLEVVGRLGVGLDNIDVDACRERSVEVRTAGAANANAVAEYVMGAAFALVRGALLASIRVAEGVWPRQEMVGTELAGRRMGLVGLGGIARLVATKAAALGMDVIAHDPILPADDPAWHLATSVEQGTLLGEADIISLHVPLLDSTRHLIGPGAIAAMKPEAIVINTSRGGIVDEDALLAALRSGRLGGAALDVFETEPVGPDQHERFAGVPNLILTPHIAGLTEESQRRVGEVTAENVRDVLRASEV